MRNISPASLARLANRFKYEPINILEINWAGNGRDAYADRDLPGGIKGKIKSIDQLDAILNVSGGSFSQSINVTLDDHDGSIKAILDSNDIHKRPCYLYQYFDGLDLGEKFLVFQGQVSSPITWREGDRTVSFTILSKLEDREIGFSAEEGQFDFIPDALVGRAWPMVFGTAIDVPALAITEPLIGTLTSGVAIHDYTIQMQINVLNAQRSNTLTIAAIFRDQAMDAFDNGDEDGYNEYWNRKIEAETRAGTLLATIGQLAAERDKQRAEEKSTVTIIGGEKFPQNQLVQLNIGGGIFTGSFSGQVFHITERVHPKKGLIVEPYLFARLVTRFPISGPRELVSYTENVVGEEAGFFFQGAGSTVRLHAGEPADHIVSIVPGTVLNVSARRAFEGVKRLITVPPSYYTVRTETYGSISAVIVRLNKPLSAYTDEGWEDDIFVTFQSSVGPNTVDVLEYLIGLYMPEVTTDDTSFSHVRTRLEPYPSNFAILERKNVVRTLEEIARQARCAIWLSGDTFYIKYLAETPTPVTTITEADIMPKSMEVFHTTTEDLVTKLVGEWRESYAAEKPNRIILKRNVNKYGTQEKVEDYYIYNTAELVRKSMTFWLIRQSNTWKKMRFKTTINKLMAETLDAVTLDFNQGYVANEDILAVVEKADFDSLTFEIDFEVWTPVLAGTMEAYDFGYPADVDESLIFPTITEIAAGIAGGDGPGKDATGDVTNGTVFVISPPYRPNQEYGDPHPSDTGDVAPPLPPIVNTGTFDFTDPGLVTPTYEPNVYDPGTTDSVIDIHRTVILDSVEGTSSRLSSFFRRIQDGKLQMDTEAVVTDGTVAAPFHFRYDTETAKYGAGTAFLEGS